MKSRFLTGLAGLAAVGLLALGACGSPSGADDEDGLSGKTLEVAGVWSGDEQASLEAVLDLFEQQTGATVKYTSAGDDLPTVLQTRVDGKTPPNVALLPQPGLIKQFAQQDALVPLSDQVRELVDENYVSLWKDLGAVNGTEYGVYFKAANKSTVWYNTGLFDEAGVTPPATMDDLVSTSAVLSDNGIPPISIGGADGWVLTDWFENVYLHTAGPEMYDKLSRHEIPWTDRSVDQALEVLAEVFTEQNLAGGRSGTLQTEFPTSVSNVFGDDEQAAMVYEGDFVAGVIASSTSAKVGTDAKFFPFPTIAGSEPSAVVGGDVAVAFVDDKATNELMKFLASPEAAAVWAERGGFLSPNKNVAADAYADDLSKDIAQQLLDAGENVRFDMSDLAPAAFGATKGAGEWKILQDFLADPADRKAVMSRLESEAKRAFG